MRCGTGGTCAPAPRPAPPAPAPAAARRWRHRPPAGSWPGTEGALALVIGLALTRFAFAVAAAPAPDPVGLENSCGAISAPSCWPASCALAGRARPARIALLNILPRIDMDQRFALVNELIVVDVKRDDEPRDLRRNRHRASVRIGVVGGLYVAGGEIEIAATGDRARRDEQADEQKRALLFRRGRFVLRRGFVWLGALFRGKSRRARVPAPSRPARAVRFRFADPSCNPLDCLSRLRQTDSVGACAPTLFRYIDNNRTVRYGYMRKHASR